MNLKVSEYIANFLGKKVQARIWYYWWWGNALK